MMMTAMLRSVPYFISVFIVTLSTCVILVYDDDCYVKICAILYQCVYVYVKYLCNTRL